MNNLQELGFDYRYLVEFNRMISCLQYDVTPKEFRKMLQQETSDMWLIKIYTYMYELYIGEKEIDTDDLTQLCKHLKFINPHIPRVKMEDLEVSAVRDIPRLVVIEGIQDTAFKIYNRSEILSFYAKKMKEVRDNHEKTAKIQGRMKNSGVYLVEGISSSNVNFTSVLKPQISYKGAKEIPSVIGIKKIGIDSKTLHLWVNKKYCRLLNRYVIVASLRRPEFYISLREIVTGSGSVVYLYAQDIGVKKNFSYNSSSARVYDFGFQEYDIEDKLDICLERLENTIPVYKTNKVEGNVEFNSINTEPIK